ncbi:hypothetical protein COCSADRAFT_99004, partial [Bipolaris sorokiniana ND90Pr]
SKEYTIFYIYYRTYKTKILLFRLYNSLVTYERYINNILINYLDNFHIVYLDNIFIYSKLEAEYI